MNEKKIKWNEGEKSLHCINVKQLVETKNADVIFIEFIGIKAKAVLCIVEIVFRCKDKCSLHFIRIIVHEG